MLSYVCVNNIGVMLGVLFNSMIIVVIFFKTKIIYKLLNK